MAYKLCVIGSGNWGSVVAKIAATNIAKMAEFQKQVKVWVYPEMIGDRNLVDIINTDHENVKYLPDIKLPENFVADSSIESVVKDADFLVFILPHQFLDRTCAQIKPHLKPGAIGVSFVKGLFSHDGKINLVSSHLKSILNIPVCAVSGANVANEVAREKFAEATMGFDHNEVPQKTAKLLQKVFSASYFRVTPIEDMSGVEIGGALKNIVALAAGFVDGLEHGSNTKAAILRIGMCEMKKFADEFFKGTNTKTFWESCGFADLITTCYAGRNRKCAEEFVRSGRSWEEIEKEMLNGQKLQGTLTCKEVYDFLEKNGKVGGYPLFEQIYLIAFGDKNGVKAKPETIVSRIANEPLAEIVSFS